MSLIRKTICLIFTIFFTTLTVFANTECEYKCLDNYSVNGTFASTLSKVTGMNTLLSFTLESQVKKQLDKALGGDFDVDIIPFGGKSLLQGKFKKLQFSADSATLDGLHLSNIKAESVCEYNHFVYKNGEVYTNEDFVLSFSAQITNDDLKEFVSSSEYQKVIKSLNVGVGNFSFLKVYEPNAQIIDNKLVFDVKILSPLTYYEPKTISTTLDLVVENGKLIFTEISTTPRLKTNLNSILPLINKINPFIVNLAILNNNESNIRMQDIKIVDNTIFVKGLVIVPKNYYNN